VSPFSTPVLLGAAVLSSPTLWRALSGQSRIELGISRYLIAVLLCWSGLSLVAMLVGPAPQRRPATAEEQAAGEAGSTGRA
jgi:hypothetical protein